MSRILAIALVIVIMSAFASNAQESVSESRLFPKAVFGVKGGMNISRFSASVNSESRAKAGFALGIYLKKQIDATVFFRPELYYSNQGQKDNYVYPYGGPSIGSTTTNMHYVNVPLLVEFGRTVSFQAGGQIGLLVVGKEKGTVASVEVNEDLRDVMTAVDLSLVIGIGLSPAEHFNCGIRINYGFSNIYSPDVDAGSGIDLPAVHNRVLHCYVAYSF